MSTRARWIVADCGGHVGRVGRSGVAAVADRRKNKLIPGGVVREQQAAAARGRRRRRRLRGCIATNEPSDKSFWYPQAVPSGSFDRD